MILNTLSIQLLDSRIRVTLGFMLRLSYLLTVRNDRFDKSGDLIHIFYQTYKRKIPEMFH